jgi:methylated-DNA-[protein]-cysteine S-methyltransferase
MSYQAIFAAPFAALGIRTARKCLTGIDFLPPDTPSQPPQDALAARVCEQLAAYLADPGYAFDLPLCVVGTSFRQKVWQALCAVPPGEPLTYGELARRLGSTSSARAVGQACGANPIPIVIPCHRVVGKRGLGGFMGHGSGDPLDIKRWLLRHEQTQRRPA